MGDPPSSNIPMPPSPPTIPKSNLPMLYYGLVIVGTAVIVLVLYNLIILRWCSDVTNRRSGPTRTHVLGPTLNQSFNLNYVYSFKYKKDGVVKYEGNGYECAVCLSVFEEGEELRQLPKCDHSFHASCIDTWLYSHMDCPLCRSAVEPPDSRSQEVAKHSRDGLLGPGTLV